jgi:uncharacterized membrane protein
MIMGLRLCNGYRTTIWTAIMFHSPVSCAGDGGDFEMMGWWETDPGACKLVYANDLADTNRFWYIFAQARDGTIWSGPFQAAVTAEPFGGSNWCFGAQHTSAGLTIGYREIDIGDNDDFRVTFVR